MALDKRQSYLIISCTAVIFLLSASGINSHEANAIDTNGTGIPVHITPPIPSALDNQTMINAALTVPEIKAWSDKWQYAGMDFNGTGNPIVWKHAIVLLYSSPDANTPLKCANGWTARVQVDLVTKQVLHAWYPDMQSVCTGYAQLGKADSGQVHVVAKSASLTPSTHNGYSEATENDVSSHWYGNEAFFPTPSYSSNIFKDMNALVGFTLNDNFNTANGFTQGGWIITEIPGCGGCGLSAGTAALAYVDESISGAGDAAYNIGYTWVNGQNTIAEVICNTSTSKYDIDITYGGTYSHHTNISCSTYQANDIDNNSVWFENQNTIQSSLWSGDITSSVYASHAYKFDYQAVNFYAWSSSNDYDRTAGVDQTSSVMTGSVASSGTATWSSLSNVPLFTDSNSIYVSSQDTSFNPHQGMGVSLYQGSTFLQQGSTPALFESLTSGQSYNVYPQDYGGYYFDYWKYSGDSVDPKAVTAGGTIQTLVPVYSTTAVQIKAQDENGNPLSMYVTLYDSSGHPIRTGFTPVTFGLNYGQTYSVTAADYAPYYFNYWDDDHTNQVRSRSFAVYGVVQTYTVDFSTTAVQITSTDSSNNAITGLYVPLSENGQVVKQGWTPQWYGIDSGTVYTVTPNDYGSYYFNHWTDGWNGARTKTINIPHNTISYNAVFYSQPASGFEITATDWDNNPLTGFYVPINPCGGDSQCSGFTPAWFTYLFGAGYTVTPNDYGNYYFNNWQDTGSTTRARSIAPSTELLPFNADFRICENTLTPNNHHCYALETGSNTDNTGNQFNTTITNIQPSNPCNFITVEQWDVFQNGDWVENGFLSGYNAGGCITYQTSFHAYNVTTLGGYHDFSDATVSVGSNHVYVVQDLGQDGTWSFLDNGNNQGSIASGFATAKYAHVGTETTDPAPSIPVTSESQIQYRVGSTWQNWTTGILYNLEYPPVWVANCSDYPVQHIHVGTGTPGSC